MFVGYGVFPYCVSFGKTHLSAELSYDLHLCFVSWKTVNLFRPCDVSAALIGFEALTFGV